MRSYLAALRIGGISGIVVGLAAVIPGWTWDWPRLGLMRLGKSVAIAWLIAVLLSLALGRLLARRPASPRASRPAPWRRAAGAALTAVALAPVALWLGLALPGGHMREAMAAGRRKGDRRPNLVLIVIDALRADHLAAYGSADGLTPNIDSFAAEATQYDAAYASSPWTLTSIGALLTSRRPSFCGLKTANAELRDWYLWEANLPDDVPLLSEQLQRSGYATAAELTNPFLARERGLQRGFQHFRNEDGDEIGSVLTPASTVTGQASRWLELNGREPFFLWVHYLDPHVPYRPPDMPAELRAKYPPSWITARAYWYQVMQTSDPETRARYQEFCRKMYAEEVRYVDRWFGELIVALKEAGLYEDSLVVVTADHGEELFDHGGFEHGHSMYEELLRVPLLVKWPRATEADGRISQTVGLLDLAPTFLEFAGAPPMPGMEGAALPRKDGLVGAEVYSEGLLYGRDQTALTGDDYKVIYHPHAESGERQFEVYDRRSDREEQRDLAGTEAASDLRVRLEELTDESRVAASQMTATGKAEFRNMVLTEERKRRLRALGYL